MSLFQPTSRILNGTNGTSRYAGTNDASHKNTLKDTLDKSQKPKEVIGEATEKLKTAIETSSTQTLILLDTLKQQNETIETYFKTLPEGTKKDAVADAIRESHKTLADAIIKKLNDRLPAPPSSTSVTRSRSTSSDSTHSSFSTASGISPWDPVAKNMADKLNFFTQSTLGRFTVATYLVQQHESSTSATSIVTETAFPASLYMTDMAGAQADPFFAASAALYPKGLIAAAVENSTSATTSGSGPTPAPVFVHTLASISPYLAHFEKPTDAHGKLPLEQEGTYMPFVKSSTEALLANTLTETLRPELEAAMKKDLPNQIKAKVEKEAKKTWLSDLSKLTANGSPQWATQFAGFEKELCTGLCLAQKRDTPDKSLLKLTMSIANHLDTPETYEQVINTLSDSNLDLLIGPHAYPMIQALVSQNTAWQSAIGARLDALDQSVQKDKLHAVLNVEVKLNEAKSWVSKEQRSHVGLHTDFMISPRMMLPHLKAHPIAAGHEQEKFCKAVDSFCANPTAANAPNINALYSEAKALAESKITSPKELKVRIDLILGINEKLAQDIADTQASTDISRQTWDAKAPIDKIKTSAKSSHQAAIQALQTESKTSEPKTLRDWVFFFRNDGAAKVAKYTAQRNSETTTATKNMYNDIIEDSTKFETTMKNIAAALDKKDLPAARKLLQEGMTQVGSDVTGLKKGEFLPKREKVLTEIAQVYRRLDRGISEMAAKNSPSTSASTSPPAHTTSASITHTPRKAQPVAEALIPDLAPSLRVYEAGMATTNAEDIPPYIQILEDAVTASKARVTAAQTLLGEFSLNVLGLEDTQTELGKLHTLVSTTIPNALGPRDAAINALGAKPAAGAAVGDGLYTDLFNATARHTELKEATVARQRELDPLEQELSRLRDTVPAANTSVGDATSLRDATQQEIDDLGQNVIDLTTENETLTREIDALPDQIDTLTTQLERKVALIDLNAQAVQLTQRLAALRIELPVAAPPEPDEDEAAPLVPVAPPGGRTQEDIDLEIATTTALLSTNTENITNFVLPDDITTQEALLALPDNGPATLTALLATKTQTRTDNLQRINAIPGEIDPLRIRLAREAQTVIDETAARDLLTSTTIPAAQHAVTAQGLLVTAAQQAEDAQLRVCQNLESEIATQEGHITTYEKLVIERDTLAGSFKKVEGGRDVLIFAPDTEGGNTYNTLTAEAIADVQATNNTNLAEATAQHDRQKTISTATKKKEEGELGTPGIQHHLGDRMADLDTKQQELRSAAEVGTFLGELQRGKETYGDTLDALIASNPGLSVTLADIRTDILAGRFSDAITKLTHLPNVTNLRNALEAYAKTKSILRSTTAPITITQKSTMFVGNTSLQEKALEKAGGSIGTLEGHLNFAEAHAAARLAKASGRSADLSRIIDTYAKCVNGVGEELPLKTLLLNQNAEDRKAAITRLDHTISDIALLFDSQDPKAERIKNEIIDILTTLKREIETVEKDTPTSGVAPTSKHSQASRLREALIAMSDVTVVPGRTAAATPKKQDDFYSIPEPVLPLPANLAASPTAESRITSAQAALEKRGLYHNPKATWASYADNDAKKNLFFAHVYAKPTLEGILTNTSKGIVDFKDAVLALSETDRAPLQALYDLATTLSDSTRPDYSQNIASFKAIHTQLQAVTTAATPPTQDNLKHLHAHTATIAEWMKNPNTTIPGNPQQQALLLELGLLIDASKPASTPESDASFARIYRHRPLTDSLIADLETSATMYADEPVLIGCMADALGQALRLPATASSTPDKRIGKLCEASKTWAATLSRHPWGTTPLPKERLQKSILAYQQASALYERLNLEKSTQAPALASTLENLFADIQAGVTELGIQTSSTSQNSTPATQLKWVSSIRIPAAETAPSTAAARMSRPTARPTAASQESPLSRDMKTALSGGTPITRVPDAGLYTKFKVGRIEYSVMEYKADATQNPPKKALKALWGTPSIESFGTLDGGTMTLFTSTISDAAIQTNLSALTATRTHPIPDRAKEFLRDALRQIAKETGNQEAPNILTTNATLKAILDIDTGNNIPADTIAWLNDTAVAPANVNDLAKDFAAKITQEKDRPLNPLELLFIAAMQEKPLAIMTLQDKGNYTCQHCHTTSDTAPLTMLEYRNGEYLRWEPVGHHQPKTIGASVARPTRVNIPYRSTMASSVRDTFGATFGENDWDTNITCWLEAAIYSATYDPQQALNNKLDRAITAADRDNKGLSGEKIQFLKYYRAFLSAAARGGHVDNIAKLNADAQALYFESGVEQQDPMEFLRMVHADLDTLLAETETYTRTQTLHVHNSSPWREGEPEAGTYLLHNKRVKLGLASPDSQTHANPAKSVPIHISLGGLTAGALQGHLTTESGSDSYETGTQNVVTGKTISYAADTVDHLPDECHITVSRPYDKATHALGKAPYLAPSDYGHGKKYIELPATINGTHQNVRYNISQIIAHSGYAGGGHYVCYFQPDPAGKPTEWYKKTSNGNAATKLPGGYGDVQRELEKGDLTYTYMGVKVKVTV